MSVRTGWASLSVDCGRYVWVLTEPQLLECIAVVASSSFACKLLLLLLLPLHQLSQEKYLTSLASWGFFTCKRLKLDLATGLGPCRLWSLATAVPSVGYSHAFASCLVAPGAATLDLLEGSAAKNYRQHTAGLTVSSTQLGQITVCVQKPRSRSAVVEAWKELLAS